MNDPVEYALALGIFVSILALGAVITIGNERVRQATLQVRQVAHDYALADLAMRREQARRSISFADQAECLHALEQLALDASKERREFMNVSVAPGPVAALIASGRDGAMCIFTPSAQTFIQANPAYGRRVVGQHCVNGLVSNPFAVEELEAVGRWHGLSALPRTEEWSLLIVPTEDYSLLPQQRWLGWLRFKWS